MRADLRGAKRDRIRISDRAQRLVAKLLVRLPASLASRLAGGPPRIVDGQRLDPGIHLLRALRARVSRYGLTEPTIAIARLRYRRDTAALISRLLIFALVMYRLRPLAFVHSPTTLPSFRV